MNACNEYAARQAGPQREQRDKVVDVAKDAAIGGILGAGGGTLYGINENRKQNEQYRTAYASCMRTRGYTSQ
ncbi:MAG: hypothetical protein AUH29_00615 [Candidatus Rokubacteria bacterium 13_1_40CM_69_27]|nr:MAG: hypothetical protein AUH29_00615 [Candidatus Rokubacteria bacterium 13_1_40CM_69_27]